MDATPTRPLRKREPRWVGWVIVAAFAVAALEIGFLLLTPGAGVVVLDNAYFQTTTPPTNWCPFWETSGGPPATFEVPTGSVFNLSWVIGCEPYGPGNSTGATFLISSIISSTWGFRVTSSNVPVIFGYDKMSYFNVSIQAPDWPTIGSMVLTATGGPVPAAPTAPQT